jgi:hypothetical protein
VSEEPSPKRRVSGEVLRLIGTACVVAGLAQFVFIPRGVAARGVPGEMLLFIGRLRQIREVHGWPTVDSIASVWRQNFPDDAPPLPVSEAPGVFKYRKCVIEYKYDPASMLGPRHHLLKGPLDPSVYLLRPVTGIVVFLLGTILLLCAAFAPTSTQRRGTSGAA